MTPKNDSIGTLAVRTLIARRAREWVQREQEEQAQRERLKREQREERERGERELKDQRRRDRNGIWGLYLIIFLIPGISWAIFDITNPKAIVKARNEQIRTEKEGQQRQQQERNLQEKIELRKHDTERKKVAQSNLEQQYLDAVAQRIKSFWVLPKTRKWNSSLQAQVVITIDNEGKIMSLLFDHRSGDPIFDQLVEKAINSAAPMPRFPALIQQKTIEGGFKFRPGMLGD